MKKKLLLFFSIIIVMMFAFCTWIVSPFFSDDVSLYDSCYFIAHACGEIDGHNYTNSREALMKSLSDGMKYIEIDLGMTKDSALVCYHEIQQFNEMTQITGDSLNIIPTLEEFKSRRIAGLYSPMTFQQVIKIWEDNSFILVTDKISSPQILNKYITHHRNKVMVEAFSPEDYAKLKKEGYIPMLSIGTLSLRGECGIYNYIKMCQQIGTSIDWVVLDVERSNFMIIRIFKRLFGIKVAMYTSNSPAFWKQHLGKEIDLVYTDRWKKLAIQQ